ncbi:MAG: serine/threonine-protein kinase, partial [Planctomycetota bacterium]
MPATPQQPTRPRGSQETGSGADDATFVPDSGAATEGAAGTPAPAKPKKKKKVTQVGGFMLSKKLGAGGMGDVYLAKQTKVGRNVALKTLKPELAKRPDFVARFMREVESMGRLDHPNVIRIYDADTIELGGKPFAYAAIEYVDGQSLQDWMDQRKSLSVPDAVAITLVVADALRHAHELNMIHRDIKPDNVLLTKRGVVKVADFGLAKAIDEDQSLTQSGVGMGTPLYMAPEQARNAKHVDQRSDIYALGATLYYFLTGDLPFRAESTIALLQAKEAGRFESARKKNGAIPERLDFIIDKMMARDPERRYATCEEVIADLSNLNLAAATLSFIDDAALVGSGASAPTSVGKARATKPARTRSAKAVTSRSEAEKQKAAKAACQRWFVQNPGRAEQRMTTEQILKGLATGVF